MLYDSYRYESYYMSHQKKARSFKISKRLSWMYCQVSSASMISSTVEVKVWKSFNTKLTRLEGIDAAIPGWLGVRLSAWYSPFGHDLIFVHYLVYYRPLSSIIVYYRQITVYYRLINQNRIVFHVNHSIQQFKYILIQLPFQDKTLPRWFELEIYR